MSLLIERRPSHILVHGGGLASFAEAQQHFREFSSLLVTERRSTKGVRLMIDLRAATPHPAQVSAHIARVLPVLYRANDRVAVAVRDSIRKNETKVSHNPSYTDVFLSRDAAEAYLSQGWLKKAS